MVVRETTPDAEYRELLHPQRSHNGTIYGPRLHIKIILTVLSRVYTPCTHMRRQPVQMSTLVSACASPLHSTSCAVDKSINTRAYASVYVCICPYAEQRVGPRDLGALSWLAGMPAQTCAGLESSKCLNFDSNSRRTRAYELGATGDRSINSCADSRHMRASARTYVRMEYKPGFIVVIRWSYVHNAYTDESIS